MPTFAARQHPHLTITRRSSRNTHHVVLPREPGLINLPLPLPSIPILDPVITPLIGGNNQPAPTPASPPPATTPPAGTTTAGSSQPTSGSGDGNGNGNGNGNGGGNGNGNGNGGSSSGGSGDGNSGSGNSGSGNSGSGNSGSGNSGSTGGSAGSSGPAQPTDGSSPPSSGGNNSDGSVTDTNLPSGTGTASSSSASPSKDVFTEDGNTPVNAGNDPSENTTTGKGSGTTAHSGSATHAISVNIPGVTGTPRTGSTEGGGDGSGGGNGGIGATGQGGKTGGISGGAVAGIVVPVLLVAAVLIIIIFRRRRNTRRSEQRDRWWFSRKRTSQTYGDREFGDSGIGGGRANMRRSVRSSFETTVDHSQTPRLDLNFDIPALPPMAELRGQPVLVNLDSPISPRVMVTQHNATTTPDSRFSVGTVSSVGSDSQGQWLIVNPTTEHGPGTPMSVRPFSPTESFAFPKPPTEKSSGDWSSQISRPPSSYTLNAGAGGAGSLRSAGPGIAEEDIPQLPTSPIINPFSDPSDPIALHAAAVAALGIPTAAGAAVETSDPFADPTPPEPSTPSAVHPQFMEVETVKRPFIPTLGDELAVNIGDKVRILQMFDDGWALVEKNPVFYTGLPDVKGKGRQPENGLIPIDCFRDHGVDVSAFIASKRVSSYSQASGKFASGGMAV